MQTHVTLMSKNFERLIKYSLFNGNYYNIYHLCCLMMHNDIKIYTSLIDSIDELVIVIDENYNIVFYNKNIKFLNDRLGKYIRYKVLFVSF